MEVWREAVDRVGGKVPPARVVKQIVEERKQIEVNPLPIENRFDVNQIVRVTSKAKEHRTLKGCWGQVISLEENSYSVLTWNAVTEGLRHEDLEAIASVDTESAWVYLRTLSRLRLALFDAKIDDSDLWEQLKHFGTKQNPQLTNTVKRFLVMMHELVGLEEIEDILLE